MTPRDPPCALIRSRLPNPSPPPCAAVPSHGAVAAPPHHPTPAHRSRAEAPRRLQGRPAPTQGVQEPSAPLLRPFPRAPLRLAASPRRQEPCATSPATRSPGENPQPSPVLLALEFVVHSPWRRPERSQRPAPQSSPLSAPVACACHGHAPEPSRGPNRPRGRRIGQPRRPPPRSRAPATYRRRSRARIVSAVRS